MASNGLMLTTSGQPNRGLRECENHWLQLIVTRQSRESFIRQKRTFHLLQKADMFTCYGQGQTGGRRGQAERAPCQGARDACSRIVVLSRAAWSVLVSTRAGQHAQAYKGMLRCWMGAQSGDRRRTQTFGARGHALGLETQSC